MARPRHYPFVRFVIALLYALAVVSLLGGIALGSFLWYNAETIAAVPLIAEPLYAGVGSLAPARVLLVAMGSLIAGLSGFLVFGTIAQLLTMQRDLAHNAAVQTQLLDSLLDQNEEALAAGKPSRVDLCEGCGRLGALHRIESGQWICRECRRQLRTA